MRSTLLTQLAGIQVVPFHALRCLVAAGSHQLQRTQVTVVEERDLWDMPIILLSAPGAHRRRVGIPAHEGLA